MPGWHHWMLLMLNARGVRMPSHKKKHEPTLWLPLALLQSSAWQNRSINCRRLLDFLAIEDVSNAGRKNGSLNATYGQLRAFGIPQRKITEAILEAEALGLIEVEHGPRIGAMSRMSRFRLTYTQVYKDGRPLSPTHEWKKLSGEDVSSILGELKSKRASKEIQKRLAQSSIQPLSLKTAHRIH